MSPVEPFDDAVTPRAVVRDDGIVAEWSEGARRLLGRETHEVVGRPAAELLADPEHAPLPPLTEPRSSGTLTLRHRDGHKLSVWLLAHRRPSVAGAQGGWLVVGPPVPEDPAEDPSVMVPLDALPLDHAPCAMALCDRRLRLRSANRPMAEVLGLPEDRVRGLRLSEIGGPAAEEIERHMRQVLTSGESQDVRIRPPTVGDGHPETWLASMAPVADAEGRVWGICLTAHDYGDQYRARERLQLVNEAGARIGTTLDVTVTAQELADVCVPSLADFVGVDLLEGPAPGTEPQAGPLTAPFGLSRAAQRSVSGCSLDDLVEPHRLRTCEEGSAQADALTAGHAVTASAGSDGFPWWLSQDPAYHERAEELGIHSVLAVPLRARGTMLGVAVLVRFTHPEQFSGDDVLLAEEVAARAAVCIDNARRYTQERETAITLQRSLLPRNLPRTAAVEAASRYLPATRAGRGVGGDWFDVIPLSGMRVAMVVGDVVGHGVQASATMGRLRTAVSTLADIDLAPDELLTHLDDLVVRLSEEAGGEGGSGEVGATCLYAVYDPISRRCCFARAGHPPPVMFPPGGEPGPVELPAGPPLGLGGLPFESAEVSLPEGTVLGFYTDGLLKSRERDMGESHRILCQALAGADGDLEEDCDRVLGALLPAGDALDDVALLLARTQVLPASQVATWDIPADPALVAPIRKQVGEQLAGWRLTGTAFVAELVVSELVTNAIRYGARPIRLRLIHDAATLIFEVSDASHTAPHLRRARTFDEGGRGLLLVAQLTQRWGSRYTPEGKTIWAEMTLTEEY